MRLRNVGKSLVVAAGLAVSLSACGMARQQPPQPATPQAGSGSGSSSSSQTSGSSGSSSSSSPDLSTCDTGQMAASFQLATTGSVDGYLKVTNAGKESCTLGADYPAIEFTNREGTGIEGVTYTQGGKGSGVITLEPGESANSDIEWQASGTSCVARVWALNLRVHPTDVPKSVDPMLPGQTGGQVFDLCGTNVTVGSWRKG
jgi:uncharacterized protein DUF4232